LLSWVKKKKNTEHGRKAQVMQLIAQHGGCFIYEIRAYMTHESSDGFI